MCILVCSSIEDLVDCLEFINEHAGRHSPTLCRVCRDVEEEGAKGGKEGCGGKGDGDDSIRCKGVGDDGGTLAFWFTTGSCEVYRLYGRERRGW